MGRTLWLSLGVVMAFLGMVVSAPASAQSAPAADRCAALATVDFARLADAPSEISDARTIAAHNGKPAYCKVSGYVWPQIGFELDLPLDGWNRKFLQAGCGGFCGSVIDWFCANPVAHRFACIATDLGHHSADANPYAATLSALWAYGNLQAQVDHAFRGAHVVAIAGKAIAEHFYGVRPRLAYFIGCSDGGREALTEAQKFPNDFNGIVAGAPANDYAAVIAGRLWTDRLAFAGGKPLFDAAAIELVGAAVIAACDMDDGIKDGLVGDPRLCRFKPDALLCKAGATTGCLSAAQAAALDQLYAGPRTADGKPLGGGLSSTVPLAQLYAPGTKGRTGALSSAEDFLRYFGLSPAPGPGWSAADFDPDRGPSRLSVAGALLSATNPDLRRFASAGGKLILYHGWDDPVISPLNSIDYYESVERQMGGAAATRGFARLFMIPGMDHCSLGPGAWDVDFLAALDAWVDRGTAPDALIGAAVRLPADPARAFAATNSFPLDPATITFTRPFFPYPAHARYRSGDPAKADSFAAAR